MFILLLVVMAFYYLQSNQSDENIQSGMDRKVDPALKPFVPEIEEIKRLKKNNPEAAEKRAESLLERLSAKFKRYLDFGFKAGMLPINFYGQIVDQHGTPVTDAKVVFETTGAYLAPGKGIGFVLTDSQGRYEIHSEGGKLRLAGIVHPYATLKFAPINTKSTRFKMIYGGQPREGANELLWSDTTPENPHVFTAWRVEAYENVESGYMKGHIEPNGNVYTFDFDRKDKFGKLIGFAVKGAKDGHIHVTCTRSPMADYGDWKDWEMSITPIDGGIQSTDDYYLNLAPETGYQPSLTIEQRKESTDYQPRTQNQRYYFTAKNGQIYGSLFVGMQPHAKPEICRFDVRFKINTNGSRNLAVKFN
ncbi:MAG: Ig-like domain-containing protein [Candidatus Thiodiazotropha sp. (ex Semelilucina semeliformis)]|nr:Ig-like domain-containing protein [Candidatus Thiodiazotropha sp. (ex Semelilucina semeliformis)]